MFFVVLMSLPCMAADILVAQSAKLAQAFYVTGAAVSSGSDMLAVIEGAEPPGAMLLKASGGRFTAQTPLAVPDGFLYFAASAASVPAGLLFAGIDYRGSTMLFTTDVTGSKVTRVGMPQGIHSVSIFQFGGELWIAGQSDRKSPIVGRINQSLDVEHITTLPQTSNALTRKIAKQGDTYFALTQAIGPPDQTYLWKLAPSGAVLAKQRILGIGAAFSLSDRGIAVCYNKKIGPTVEFLSFDLKPMWSTRLLTPRNAGAEMSLIPVQGQWIVVGGDNDRTYVARLSAAGVLQQLTYDQNTPPHAALSGYVLQASNHVLSIIGSDIDANLAGPKNYTIFSYTVELNSP